MDLSNFENTAIHLKLFEELGKAPGNLFFSAHSLQRVLALLLLGARGETAVEMGQALCLEGLELEAHRFFRELGAKLSKSAGDCILNEANRVWGRQGLPFEQSFLEALDQGAFQGADFSKKAALVKEINDWVSAQTRGKIASIITEKMLTENTLLVLINALYFKGQWKNQFDAEKTRDQFFWINSKDFVSTPIMTEFKGDVKEKFNHLTEDGWDFLELPYAGSDLAMVFIKPTVDRACKSTMDLLGKVYAKGWTKPLKLSRSLSEFKMTHKELTATLSKMKPTDLLINIPRFRLEHSYKLVDPLANMGMKQAFSATQANFQGVLADPDNPLFIGLVIQKSFVEVNEEGTEAAAVTAVLARAGGAPKINVFRADHPFLFLIRDRKTGLILFMGRVENPMQKASIRYLPPEDKGLWQSLREWWG
ncbi:MAG: serpin family protein [Planctomycetota bacterium]|nr:serpin family protein [Planctomycetota bacterium]